MVIFFSHCASISISSTMCAVIRTENSVASTPMSSVTPKPLIGPVPRPIMMPQMINWTACASMMVQRAFI